MFEYNPLISVIIPVYNVEKYLKDCLDSVINQTYKNLEIICVDDYSSDNCSKILEDYSKMDSRIKVITNTENIGLGLSRNRGIITANGEYIHCLDSDDWMEQDAYKILVQHLNFIGKVDIIRFAYYKHNLHNGEMTTVLNSSLNNNKILNIYKDTSVILDWTSSAWIKLIKTNFIRENKLFYNNHRCFEDVGYSIEAIVKAKTVFITDDCLLHYRENRKGSLLNKKYDFIDCLINDVKMATKLSANLSLEVKNYVLNYSYFFLLALAMDAYYYNKLSYKKLQKIFVENISYEVIKSNDYYSKLYADKHLRLLKEYKPYKFFIEYKLKRFIRTLFPNFTKNYIKLKRSIGIET